jgi:hypothetical protein
MNASSALALAISAEATDEKPKANTPVKVIKASNFFIV